MISTEAGTSSNPTGGTVPRDRSRRLARPKRGDWIQLGCFARGVEADGESGESAREGQDERLDQELQLNVAGLRPHRQARIRIQDDGPGISADHLPRIFDRFYRVDRARTTLRASDDPDNDPEAEDRRRGTGLGLAIARWIARTHGGEIAVSSVVGQGSVFEVILPLPD